MPDNPVDNEQYCYPWSPEELIEDDKYKSVSVSQLYMYMSLTLSLSEEVGATQSLVELQIIIAGAGACLAVTGSWIGRPWRRTGQ